MTDSTDTASIDEESGTSVDDLKALLREAEEALGNADSGTSDDVQALRERLRDVLAEGQSTVKRLSESVRRQAGRADEAVRAKPYQALGVAAVVGLLAGLILSRRSSKD